MTSAGKPRVAKPPKGPKAHAARLEVVIDDERYSLRAHDGGWMLRRLGQTARYQVAVVANRVVCDCPSQIYRPTETCKHGRALVALKLLVPATG